MENTFSKFLSNLNQKKKILIYIDMDGVVADYNMMNHEGDSKDVYLNKRPLKTIINIFEKINDEKNIELHILSVTRHKIQITGKLTWLEKEMPFIKKENIHIISREEKDYIHPSKIKTDFIKHNIKNNEITIHIDDDHLVLKEIKKNIKEIIVLHPSSIID